MSGKITDMVATFFCKNLSRWQVAGMKVLIKKKFQVKKKKSFVELENAKQLLTKSGLMMTNAKAFSTTETMILFTVPIVIICGTDDYVAHQGIRDLKRDCGV